MVKLFIPNKNGKIEFTESELENLLNEVWRDGYNSNYYYTWYSPWCSPWYTNSTKYPYTTSDYTVTTANEQDKITPTAVSIKIGE